MQSITAFSLKKTLHENKTLFSHEELEYCRERISFFDSLAGIFCAKEAFVKAIAGLPDLPSYSFTDIVVVHAKNGRPAFSFSGALLQYLCDHHLTTDLSITHTADTSGALVALIKD